MLVTTVAVCCCSFLLLLYAVAVCRLLAGVVFEVKDGFFLLLVHEWMGNVIVKPLSTVHFQLSIAL